MKDVITNTPDQATGLYLMKKGSKVVHFWTGSDTVCRRWSTSNWHKDEYDIITNPLDKEICHQCGVVAIKLGLDV